MPFPLLGRDYTDAFTAFVNERLAGDRGLDPEEMFAAFRIVEFRPQLLLSAVQTHVFGGLGEDPRTMTLIAEATVVREGYWSEFDALWAGLSPLQQAVLDRLIAQATRFRPFDAEALAAYGEVVGRPVAASDAQAALDALRVKGLIVRLERGIYTLEDASLADWFSVRFAPSTTPEVPPT